MLRKLFMLGLFACLLAQSPALSGKAFAEGAKGSPIILITLDTTRKDAVSFYGLGIGQTPRLDQFAKDAVVFNNAFSDIPHTLPAHMSIFTGLLPDTHQVIGRGCTLSDKVKTIPQYLKAAGYKTAGVYAFDWLKPEYGFGRDYDYYQYAEYGLKHAARVNKLAVQGMEKLGLPKTDKFFLFLHYYDAHSDFLKGQYLPYIAPEPLIKKYTHGYHGDFKGGDIQHEMYANPFLLKVNADEKLRNNFPAGDLDYIKGLYAAGVEELDFHIGQLFDYLKKAGIYDKALIIVMADHGEEFLEHGMFVHEQMYDELLRVPLMIKFPSSKHAGMRVDAMVESVDVLPTILDYAGVKGEPYIQGKSMMAIIDGKKWEKKSILIHSPHRRDAFAVRTDKAKLIIKGKTFEYYDLTRDPKEKVPVLNPKFVPKDIVKELNDRRKECFALSKYLRASKTNAKLSKEEEDRLKSLGYIH